MRKQRRPAGSLFVLLPYAAFSLFPLLWMLVSSFKTDLQIFSAPWALPERLQWENYLGAWQRGSFSRYFLNSVLVSVTSVLGGILFSAMAGYALSRGPRNTGKAVRQFFLLGLMIPGYVTLIPLFIILKKLGWYDTHLALIVPYIAGSMPVNISLMYAAYRSIPVDLDEAALIDGAGPWRVFSRVLLPLVRPTTVTLCILMFISVWNEFINVIIFINKPELKTLQAGLMAFRGIYQTDYAMLFAGLVITIAPIILLFLALEEKIAQGMTAGALRD